MRRKILIFALFVLMSLFLSACVQNNTLDNYPLEPDGPAPDPHDGVYVSEYGSLIFNGDDESITVQIGKELAQLFQLEEGEYDGSYVFLSGNLPPHGSFPVRYDAAHELQIDLDNNGTQYSKVFDIGVASEDGKSGSVGLNTVTYEKIPLLFKDDNHFFTVLFEKSK